MEHIGFVETVVTELVVHNLVGGEISHRFTQIHTDFLNSEEESGFGELGGMIAIFAITDRTDSEDDADIGIFLTQKRNSLLQVVGTGFDGEFLFRKERLRTLLTVVDNFTCLFQTINVVRTEGEEDSPWPTPHPLDGVEDRGGVVHGAIGIDYDREALFLEAMAYLRGETGTYEENLFTRSNPEAWIRDIDDSSEFH
jgi:hypothetical protein